MVEKIRDEAAQLEDINAQALCYCNNSKCLKG